MVNKKIGALLLTGMTVMSTATPVFAADGLNQEGTKENPAKVSVTKNLEFAEGISTPNATFDFTASKIDAVTPDAPDATIQSIPYTKGKEIGELKDRKYVVSKTSEIKFNKFPHAGEYQYTVRETPGNMEGMTYDTNEYTLKVYVVNTDNNELYVKTITATEKDKKQKPDKLLFTNTYTRNGGSEGNKDSLVIRKEIKGDLANKTKTFKFKLIFEEKPATATGENAKLEGMIGNKTYEFQYGKEQEFDLGDNQELVFKNIPAGTRYRVTELGVDDGYKPSVDVIENGTKMDTRNAEDADDLSSAVDGANNLIGENENKVTFTNTNDSKPLTGIIAKNAPMILVAGAGVLAMLGYALTKRKFAKK